ncbi:hypothetical protein HMPREF1219_01660 [Corynebacterium pyruviciproducens ATCC BAA-1742]|uniref:Prephenate dehydratase n=1 Tax=Corynebacterium pyruviciproducens ATCC BAA-1742 TaxID=1125779 RepID=S2ZWN7_9CORY|nr:prephenate dehydratase [Corynebacterium pyruviciproducens]EPD68479.1 hypothetical protein HMPREF1219_01660 [Corynebacterium pyruviciproducens ATCC BAA-1742]
MTTVSFLGPQGTFTEQAARALVPGLTPHLVSSPAEAIAACALGLSDAAVVAIENSVDGAVTATFDALVDAGVTITAEVDLAISFTIAGTLPARRFATHPIAYQQVKNWVEEHSPGAEFVPASSNAAAADMVVAGEADACACPQPAAFSRGLPVLATDVADHARARTRFLLVEKHPRERVPGATYRTSVAFTLPNEPGTLVGALTEFASRSVDLTRIESRPTKTQLGTYIFYCDLLGHAEDEPVAAALAALKTKALNVELLGSWPAGEKI